MKRIPTPNNPAVAAIIAGGALIALRPSTATAQPPFVLKDNMAALKAAMPDAKNKFTGSNMGGQLFLPGEKVTINLELTGDGPAGPAKDYFVELQEVTTRDPLSRSKDGWTDTSGNAPLIALEGKPILVPIKADLVEKTPVKVQLTDFPLPARFGTYAMVLVRGTGETATRQFLGTLARLPNPRKDGTVDNTPIFGEGVLIGQNGERSDYYARMGVRGWRSEASWSENEDGTYKWEGYDKRFEVAKNLGCQIMITLGGHPEWTRPFKVPTPAARWTPKSNGYGGSGDWLCRKELYPRYGKWLEAFAQRYWQEGKGGLWGVENYNEPWEGGGISGWASDAPTYRELQKLIATSLKKVDPRIKILASSSIMNTEDKLYSDGSKAMDDYIDIFTDHYVPPVGCYGPMVAKAHGKESMETETWFVNSEYSLPQGAVQFLASGQSRLSPWHPRVLFDAVPGVKDNYFIPTPVVVASAAFNNMVTGKKFEKMVFPENLPFAFQFGKDADKDGLVVMFGRLSPIGSDNFKVLMWSQVNSTPGGTITIDNRDGLLQFYDLAGNPVYEKAKSVELPLTYLPTYIKSNKGPVAIAARLKQAKITGKRSVEIVPKDFNTAVTATGAKLRVELRSRLNADQTGTLTVTAPDGLALATTSAPVTLPAGGTKVLEFPVANATSSTSNVYPFQFEFKSPAGEAKYAENLNAAVVPKGTKQVDGNLDDWANIPGVTVMDTKQKADISEQLRRPWLEMQQGNPEATTGELKMAWDDNYLYLAARVGDPTTEKNAIRFGDRNENAYFHTAASDNVSPYKEFIEEFRTKTNNLARSFGEVPYVYKASPEAGIPFRRDRLQFAFDVAPGYHDMAPDTQVPEGFHAIPDADYEYSLYWVNDNKNGDGELWRHMAPGVARIHDFPRQIRAANTTGPTPGAKVAVKREGGVYTYEAAIPRSELAQLKLAAGTEFGFTFMVGNSEGVPALYGADKATTKNNSLTLHPYWENSPNTGTRWTLVE